MCDMGHPLLSCSTSKGKRAIIPMYLVSLLRLRTRCFKIIKVEHIDMLHPYSTAVVVEWSPRYLGDSTMHCVWHQPEKREVEVTLRTTIPSANFVVAAVDRTTHTIIITFRRSP